MKNRLLPKKKRTGEDETWWRNKLIRSLSKNQEERSRKKTRPTCCKKSSHSIWLYLKSLKKRNRLLTQFYKNIFVKVAAREANLVLLIASKHDSRMENPHSSLLTMKQRSSCNLQRRKLRRIIKCRSKTTMSYWRNIWYDEIVKLSFYL